MKKLLLTLFLVLLIVQQNDRNYKNYEIIKRITSFSENNLISYISNMGILYPDVVLAQAKIETGNFKSLIFTENNNLFGMKLPKRRETTAIGENRKHATYTTWLQSLIDYKMWQDKMIHRAPTKIKYLEYLSRNYAEDRNYITKIKTLL